jgi:methionyl-tRNA synthetase
VQDAEFWKMPAGERDAVIAAALGLVKVLTALLQPYMPSTSRAILAMLNGPWEWTGLCEQFARDSGALQDALPAGHKLGKPALLFHEIREEAVAALQERFSGQQAEGNPVRPVVHNCVCAPCHFGFRPQEHTACVRSAIT